MQARLAGFQAQVLEGLYCQPQVLLVVTMANQPLAARIVVQPRAVVVEAPPQELAARAVVAVFLMAKELERPAQQEPVQRQQ